MFLFLHFGLNWSMKVKAALQRDSFLIYLKMFSFKISLYSVLKH